MSAAAASFPLPRGFGAEWVKDPIDIENWPKSARRVYRFLKRRIRMRKVEHRAKDRDIGIEIGEMEGRDAPHRRTIQRGLKFLQDLGGIFRDHSDGHGRVIKVLIPLAGDDKPAAQAPDRTASPEPAASLFPGDRKAEARASAAAAGPADAPPPPPESPGEPAEDGRPVGQIWAEIRAKVEAEREAARAEARAAAQAPPGPLNRAPIRGVDPDDVRYLEVKEQLGELTEAERARLEEIRRHGP